MLFRSHEGFLTQSAVSKNISALEKTLGLELFEREKGKLSLTLAGRILHERLKGLIREFETAVELADCAQNSHQQQLRIGIPNFTEAPLLMSLTEKYQQKHPEISTQIETQDFEGLRKKIIRGDLDVIFTVMFESDSLPPANVGWILVDPMPAKLFVSDRHPLAGRSHVSIGDLRNEKFIVYSPSLVPGYSKMLSDLCSTAGFAPTIGRYVENQQSFTLALMLNEGVMIADDLILPLLPKGVVGFELENTVSGKIIVWNRTPMQKHVRSFIDLVMHSA